MNELSITKLVERQKPHHSLEQAFYLNEEVYERDVEKIFLNSWIYAGHESEIPGVGDYFLFDFASESVIVIRSAEDEVNALINVCRHRGSRVCIESKGCAKRLMCPYHAWTYELNGDLIAARTMTGSFDKSDYSLKKIHVARLDGMIFVHFAEEPAAFEPITEALSDCLSAYDLKNAKVAHRESYGIDANWKLAVENYTECYHCAPAHPEYSKAHSLAMPEARYTKQMDEVMSRAVACGLSDKTINRTYKDAVAFGADFSYERYPLLRGHMTGSEDGQPVAPLMGTIKDFDGGTTDFQIGPVTYALAYCDHIVLYRFTPLSAHRTDCDITWLVNGSAEEGRDYDLKKLTWLWDVTTIADQHIIERNQEGVNSRFYTPGPYSEMEDFTWSFVDWYLDAVR
ncbi:MAG: aromatic ring-hydroxylating oxygenase subunit alpha [Gammaproteobacteria bacterium]